MTRAERLAGAVALAVSTVAGATAAGGSAAAAAPTVKAVQSATATKPVEAAAPVKVAGAAKRGPADRGGAGGADGTNHTELRTAARFSPPMALVPSLALTYDTGLVPAGARIEVEERGGRQGTTVLLRVSGVRAGHAFGARVHTRPCGADPAAAGDHYQDRIDPLRSSADPGYVNARNEVWLDFTTDGQGAGEARAAHAWGFRSGQAGSVVILDRPGTRGVPVACFTVPFGRAGKG